MIPFATFLLIFAPSRNLGCFSIDPTITIKYTTIAKIGIVIMNQSNSEFIWQHHVEHPKQVKKGMVDFIGILKKNHEKSEIQVVFKNSF